MPRKPLGPCSYPGCPELVEDQYCKEHMKKRNNEYNKFERDDFSKNFYNTPAWRITRRKQLESYPFCSECLKIGKRSKAIIVDHIVPVKQGGDRFDSSNLQSLCWSCHSRKSIKEGSRYGKKTY